MNSPRVLIVLVLGLAAITALPTDKPIPRPITSILPDEVDDSPWFSLPMFGNLFAPLWRLFPSFSEIGPRIIADDDNFKVVVNAKDYGKDDLKVKLKNDFIFVQGTHEAKPSNDRDLFASQFFHTYALPVNASTDDLTAELSSDGYLTINVPCNGASKRADGDSKSVEREITIKETGQPYKPEETTQNADKNDKEPTEPTVEVTEQKQTTAESVDTTEKKEPTTLEKDREETTPASVKENETKEKDSPKINEVIPL